MSNLSKQRRNRMLEALEELKSGSTEEQQKILLEIKNELTSKKYGLIWEEHQESVEEDLITKIPVFKEDKGKKIVTDKDASYNLILEGDNLHSLYLLEKTHKGEVDVIYIDPPYNTGKKDFIYNDELVEAEDGYRHSKWISFMSKRLEIAHRLLSKSGVIFISIDDNEYANLKLLCDDIFDEINYVGTFIVENNPKGRKNSKFISVTNEYCLVYSKSKDDAYFKETIPKDSKSMSLDENGNYVHNSGKRVLVGENKFNKLVSNYDSQKHYSVYYSKLEQKIKLVIEDEIDEVDIKLINNNYKRYISYRNNEFVENTYSKDKLQTLFKENKLDFKADKIYEKNYSDTIRIKSVLTNKSYEAIVNNSKVKYEIDLKTTSAKTELGKIIGKDLFDYPKNHNFIKHLIELHPNKELTCVDFFAGSGTTGHAVLDLNKEDGGNRKFILCTNNENNICEDVTYPRIKAVITGKTKKGIDYGEQKKSNLKYFKTEWIKRNNVYLEDELSNRIYEMIELQNHIEIDNKKYIVIMSEKDARIYLEESINTVIIKKVWYREDIMFTSNQLKVLENTDRSIIPRNYFDTELKEGGYYD